MKESRVEKKRGKEKCETGSSVTFSGISSQILINPMISGISLKEIF